jgi:hypothetical protein
LPSSARYDLRVASIGSDLVAAQICLAGGRCAAVNESLGSVSIADLTEGGLDLRVRSGGREIDRLNGNIADGALLSTALCVGIALGPTENKKVKQVYFYLDDEGSRL